MLRKITAMALVTLLCLSTIVSAAGVAEQTVLGKLAAVENALYGNAQTGALMDRIGKLNTDFYGQDSTKSMVEQVDFLYDGTFANVSGQASTMAKVNAIEWAIMHNVTADSIKMRVENLETAIEGNPKAGALQNRIMALANLAFPSGIVTLTSQNVPADTLVKIKLLVPIDSKTAVDGDKIAYQVAEDVIVDGILLFAKGGIGTGTVMDVSRSQNFGRDAKVDVAFNTTTAIDGTVVETFLGEKAKKEMETMALAAGATIAGMALLGPVGIVTGAFVKGKNINLPIGTELYIQTKTAATIDGVAAQ